MARKPDLSWDEEEAPPTQPPDPPNPTEAVPQDKRLDEMAQQIRDFSHKVGSCRDDIDSMYELLKAMEKAVKDQGKTPPKVTKPSAPQNPLPFQCNVCGKYHENRHETGKQDLDGMWICTTARETAPNQYTCKEG